eukprot:scaffold54370_cov29-Tisochrysis_lutea.AAC.3
MRSVCGPYKRRREWGVECTWSTALLDPRCTRVERTFRQSQVLMRSHVVLKRVWRRMNERDVRVSSQYRCPSRVASNPLLVRLSSGSGRA